MTGKPGKNPLRLRRKHGDGKGIDATAADGARLVHAQSIRNAIVAGLIVFVMFCVMWIAVTAMTNRVFPWMTVVLGGMLGANSLAALALGSGLRGTGRLQ